MGSGVSPRSGGKNQQCRPETLSSSSNYVLGDRAYKEDVGTQAGPNQMIYSRHIGGDDRMDKIGLQR
jgi:hypothetical protein